MINGEYKGNGKEYNSDGVLIFEGEYLKSEKWNGIFFDDKSNIEYEIKNGNGFGKEYYTSGLVEYEGEYLNGKRWNGKLYRLEDYSIKEFFIENGIVKEKKYNNI